jgi:hypothetical protein
MTMIGFESPHQGGANLQPLAYRPLRLLFEPTFALAAPEC